MVPIEGKRGWHAMRRKLPIGIQSFEKLRRDDFVYVDKTAYVYEIAQSGLPYFLSRPRRFGKSLFVSTLRAYFEGRRELFEGLAIESLVGNAAGSWQARPVFLLSFNGADYTHEGGLEGKLDALLRGYEETWGSTWGDLPFGSRFQKLLELAHEASGHRCAVLVDEYDKPLLEAADSPGLEDRNRATLKAFYSVLKDADEHVCSVFITGVTKFSEVSIFSDLNQMRDISLSSAYAGICGITEQELLETFGPEVSSMSRALDCDTGTCLDALREQYDGYCFHPAGPHPAGSKVYNPFSLLFAFDEQRIGSYWFETGTPTFLVKRVRDAGLDPKRLTDGSIYATERRLSDYRADDNDPIPLLFQSGYLTIRAYDAPTGEYELGVPNGEVKWGLLESLLPSWVPAYSEARGTDVFTLRRYLETGDTDGIRRILEALFASIPYTHEADPFENYFQAVVWLVFTLLGRYVVTEIHQAHGRADCIVEAREHIYLFEFKRDGTAVEALEQIEVQGYATPFAADRRTLHRIGCPFDARTRQLCDWAVA